jgi:uncharacterized membrane protein
MSKAKQRFISIIVIAFASAIGLTTLLLIRAALLDKYEYEEYTTEYQTILLAQFILVPFAAGFISGLIASVCSRSNRMSRSIWAAVIQVAFVTLWWARLGEFSWRTDFVKSREWQLLVLCLPIGAIVIPLVIGLFRRDKTPLQNDANLPNDRAR